MKWRIQSFTELQHLSPDERTRLVRACVGRFGFFRMMLVPVMWGCGWGLWTGLMTARVVGVRGPWQGLFLGAGFLAGAALAYQFKLIRIRGQLLIYLEKVSKRRRLPMCLGCGYDLRGLRSNTCPECGTPIRVESQSDGTEPTVRSRSK